MKRKAKEQKDNLRREGRYERQAESKNKINEYIT
jgi:hypothetical protein